MSSIYSDIIHGGLACALFCRSVQSGTRVNINILGSYIFVASTQNILLIFHFRCRSFADMKMLRNKLNVSFKILHTESDTDSLARQNEENTDGYLQCSIDSDRRS